MRKYNARRTACNHGHSHASAREARECGYLHIRLRAGEITMLAVEPTFHFNIDGKALRMSNGHLAQYRPDFTFLEAGRAVALDVKGFTVRDFPLRAALFRHCYPDIELRVVK